MRFSRQHRRFDLLTFGIVACTMAVSTLHPRAQTQAAANACAKGDPADRIAACTELLNQPGVTGAARIGHLLSRAVAYDSTDRFDLALGDVNAALAIDARSGLALRARAAIYHNHGRTADALRDLNTELGAQPDDVAALRLRGTVYAETGQMKVAVEDFSKVLDRLPSDVFARQARGLALAATGDHNRAIQDFNRVLERNPRTRVARAARAYSLFITRQFSRAIGDWDLLLADDASELSMFYCRGAAKVLSGDDSGRADMEKVQQQKPDVAAAQAKACPVG